MGMIRLLWVFPASARNPECSWVTRCIIMSYNWRGRRLFKIAVFSTSIYFASQFSSFFSLFLKNRWIWPGAIVLKIIEPIPGARSPGLLFVRFCWGLLLTVQPYWVGSSELVAFQDQSRCTASDFCNWIRSEDAHACTQQRSECLSQLWGNRTVSQ